MSRAERAKERGEGIIKSLKMIDNYREASRLLGHASYGIRANERASLIADSVLAVGVTLLGALDLIGDELEANTAELERVRELLERNEKAAADWRQPVEEL